MRIIFEKQYLEELYEKGFTRKKKYRYPAGVIERYRDAIIIIFKADSLTELFNFHGMNLKKLKGNKKDIYSIRINNKYRLEFRIVEDDKELIDNPLIYQY